MDYHTSIAEETTAIPIPAEERILIDLAEYLEVPYVI